MQNLCRDSLSLRDGINHIATSGAQARAIHAKAGNGRRPVGLAIMLRTYFMQHWFNLSDPGVEEAFYESPTLRRFAGVDSR